METDIQNTDINLDELLERFDFVRPDRGIDTYPSDASWRDGVPDYRKADLVYFLGKTKNHPRGSLAETVENLVKKWEMEMTHLTDKKDWTTTNPNIYRVSTNGGEEKIGTVAAAKGTYNWLYEDVSKDLYNASEHTFETSHKLFRGAFKEGFPWEVLEVFSGPPKVTFTWRHWGSFTGVYEDRKGSGEVIEMYGLLIATVDDQLKIEKLEVFFKTDGFLKALKGELDPKELRGGKEIVGSGCPFIQSQNDTNSSQ